MSGFPGSREPNVHFLIPYLTNAIRKAASVVRLFLLFIERMILARRAGTSENRPSRRCCFKAFSIACNRITQVNFTLFSAER